MTVSDLTESELIARIRERLGPPPGWLVVGIGDDAAVVEAERGRLEVLTMDALVEGVHFDRRFTPPDAIGHRALAVNLSDLAAMGAAPRLALLSFALPADLPLADFDAMIAALAALACRHKTHVVGGNLTRSPGPMMIDVTLMGTVKPRQALTRSGARPGDEIYVTGSIGGAAAGLQMLRAEPPAPTDPAGMNAVMRKYLYPDPRVRVGLLLSRNRVASACVDLSDGLADGARRLSEASQVGLTIESAALPIDSAVRSWFQAVGRDPVLEAISGGDDYELLFAVRPRLRRRLNAAIHPGGVPVTRIGVCSDKASVVLQHPGDAAAAPIVMPMPHGYTHFR